MTRNDSKVSPLKVAVSIGDPHGIGPEVSLKALVEGASAGAFEPHLFAHRPFLESLAADLSLEPDWERIHVHEIGAYAYPPPWGVVSAEAGAYAVRSLDHAIAFCRRENAPLLVTAPLHKFAANLSGFDFPGQTEFIGSRCGTPDVSMAFFSERLNVLLATIHVPLREVARLLNRELLVSKGLVFHSALCRLGFSRPRIAVCGLNPHASEGGLFGDEEERMVAPAVRDLADRLGGGVTGPYSADTLFHRALQGDFDGVIALYHDQGLIPVKMTAFDSAVNATLGLPFVRTSPDHGTAFDIAGRGIANPGSMTAAIQTGLKLATSRQGTSGETAL